MKKQFFKLMILLLAMPIVFTSCKKDNNSKNSQFTYDGADYSLTKGYLAYFGIQNPDPATYGYTILLTSPEVNVDLGIPPSLSGIGDGFTLDLYSSSSTELVPGTYTFDGASSGNANTFDFGGILIDYDFSGFKTSTDLVVISGSLTVAKSGTSYEVSFSGTVEGGKTLTTYYKGTLEYHDLSSLARKSILAK